jgi:hypothetical protein
MSTKLQKQPFSFQVPITLVLIALTKKSETTAEDYKNLLMIHSLKEEDVCGLASENRSLLDAWLPTLGKGSFKDSTHLLRLADLINRVCLIKQDKAPKLDDIEEKDLDDWLSQCEENRRTYRFLTDPSYRQEIDAIDLNEVWKEIKGKSKWKIFWMKIIWKILRKEKASTPRQKLNSNMN